MTTTPFSEKLRLLRAQQGLTLTEAAEKIGITRGTLASLEKGHRKPQMPTLFMIAETYQVPLQELDTAPKGETVYEKPPRINLDQKYVDIARGALMGIDIADKELTDAGWDREQVAELRGRMLGNVIQREVKRAYNRGYTDAQAGKYDLDQPPPQVDSSESEEQLVERDA
jgi:transcriptional regulator with XRE-family HTH domain